MPPIVIGAFRGLDPATARPDGFGYVKGEDPLLAEAIAKR